MSDNAEDNKTRDTDTQQFNSAIELSALVRPKIEEKEIAYNAEDKTTTVHRKEMVNNIQSNLLPNTGHEISTNITCTEETPFIKHHSEDENNIVTLDDDESIEEHSNNDINNNESVNDSDNQTLIPEYANNISPNENNQQEYLDVDTKTEDAESKVETKNEIDYISTQQNDEKQYEIDNNHNEENDFESEHTNSKESNDINISA
eukprot:384416_1